MRHVLLLAALVGFAGCFEPEEPLCAFQCGDNNLCPDDYMCLADGYCHLHGMPGDCMFPDASVPATDGGDMNATVDMTQPPDLAGFSQFSKCNLPSDYTTQSSGATITFGNSQGTSYSRPCLHLILSETDGGSATVSWQPATGGTDTFVDHPLTPSTLGTAGNPIPFTNTGSGPLVVNFANPGFFPYYCGVHGANDTSGMAGVVWITP